MNVPATRYTLIAACPSWSLSAADVAAMPLRDWRLMVASTLATPRTADPRDDSRPLDNVPTMPDRDAIASMTAPTRVTRR